VKKTKISGVFPAKYFFLIAILFLAGCATMPLHLMKRAPAPINTGEKMRAERYFVEARTYDMVGQADNALRCYLSAYALDPGSIVLRDLLVEKFIRNGQLSRALLIVKNGRRIADLSDSDKRICAGIYMREGKLTLAAETMGRIKDKTAEDYYTVGFIHESRGDLAAAANSYSDFIKKKPESVQMWAKVGGLYTTLKKFNAAESLYVDMEHRFGQSPEVFNGIGTLKLARGDTALAINSFKTASIVDSSDLDGLRNLAQIYTKKGDMELAVPCYEKLYESDTGSVQFGRPLALLYFFTKKYDKSISLINRLLAGKKDDYELYFYKGLSFAAQDSSSADSARAAFEKAISIRSDFAEAWEQLCYLELSRKRLDSAATIAEHFMKSMPELHIAWRLYGYVCNAREEYARAVEFLKKAVELDSSDAHAWFELGISFERSGNAEQSVSAFRHTLALRPGDPAAANYLGYMWAERGIKLDSARALLSMVISQDSLNGAYIDSYAWILYKMGFIDSASVYIAKAITLIGDDPVVYSHYGDILFKKGDNSGALAAYRKSISIIRSDDKLKPEELLNIKNKISSLEKTEKNVKAPPPKQVEPARP
jgi:tetratricopeptide (TPR) repeat protein